MREKRKVIDSNYIIECPACGGRASAKEWSDKTYSECTNREMKRLFIPATDVNAFSSKKRSYYKCKSCEQWICGESLKVYDSNMNKIESLGWKPVCRIGDKQ